MRYLLTITAYWLSGVGFFALGAILWHVWIGWPLGEAKAIAIGVYRAMSAPLFVAGVLFISYGAFWAFFAEGFFRRLLVK